MITKLLQELDIRQKDFLETKEGLVFAVVSDQIEEGRSLAFLRYKTPNSPNPNRWQKLSTKQANELLKVSHPQYLFHSNVFDADLHALLLSTKLKLTTSLLLSSKVYLIAVRVSHNHRFRRH